MVVESEDEIGKLGAEFNAMVAKLRSFHELNLEQILAEKRKSDAIVRRIDDGILVTDDRLVVTAMNPAAARALAIDSQEGVGHALGDVLSVMEVVEQAQKECVGESLGAPADLPIHPIEKNGTKRDYLFSIVPMRSDSSSLAGLVVVMRDVTRLRELDRLKTEFVMTASHELRTPLTSIGMSIDLIEESAMEKLSATERKLLLAAKEEIRRIKALVNDLLDLSKIESGKIELEFEPVAIATLFDAARASLTPQALTKNVSLEFHVADGAPLVKADAEKIALVLQNLVGNALRHVDAGGRIEVKATSTKTFGAISVKDNGEGMPAEYLTRVFEKFVHAPNQRSLGGTGLGLSICREIVRAHGGAIWAESEPGKGSVFTFTLPIHS